ncbi:MAG: hexose kinase [Clostridia bacterium]|nr:hexose kinase [Clostridia bacterium]
MKAIRTVTINPCFDWHYTVPNFEAGKENLVTAMTVEAGGKGVNTSRALRVNGVENLAYIILGDENGDAFVAYLKKDDIPCRCFTVKGRIRENITVHPSKGKETRISVNTFCVPEAVFAEMEAAILSEDLPNLLVSFSGRIPTGLAKSRVKEMLKKLIAGGARVVVDSSSFTPDDLRELHPWFIKPNEQEIEAFLESAPATALDAAHAARKLVHAGVSETVMISLGGEGAAYSDGENTYVLHIPALENPVSTVGAGDSTIAGLLAGTAEGLPLEETLRLAVSYGTAACMTAGTLPPRPEDVKTVLGQVRAERV